MNKVSLNMSYNKQRLYRNILVDLGLESKENRFSSDNKNYLFSPDQFVLFVARALKDTEATFSLRAMNFRLVIKDTVPTQQELNLNQEQETDTDSKEEFLASLLSAAFGMPVEIVKIDALSPEKVCDCPACQMRETLADVLTGNLRKSQMGQNTVPTEQPVDSRPTPSNEELEDMHLRAIEWDAKISNATELAVRHYYQNHGGVSIWAIWRLLEQTGGIPDWHTFRPKSEYKDIAPRILWAQAQQLRANVLDMTA